jgi:hypothetical protein
VKHRNSRVREIAFHTLFCMVSMVSILLTMQKKYTLENDPLQAPITMREFQFFESIIEKVMFTGCPDFLIWSCTMYYSFPGAYTFLRSTDSLILPHMSYLKKK